MAYTCEPARRELWACTRECGHSRVYIQPGYRLQVYIGYYLCTGIDVFQTSVATDRTGSQPTEIHSGMHPPTQRDTRTLISREEKKQRLNTTVFTPSWYCIHADYRLQYKMMLGNWSLCIPLFQFYKKWNVKINKTKNAWQSLAYSPLGGVVSPRSE